MDIPENGKYLESDAFITWMGEDGICRTKVKTGKSISIDEARENSAMVRSFDRGIKYPLIVDAKEIRSMSREAREFLSLNNRPSPVNSIAILIGSPLSRVIGNFFIGLNKSRVPSKLFTEYDNAIKWSKTHLLKN